MGTTLKESCSSGLSHDSERRCGYMNYWWIYGQFTNHKPPFAGSVCRRSRSKSPRNVGEGTGRVHLRRAPRSPWRHSSKPPSARLGRDGCSAPVMSGGRADRDITDARVHIRLARHGQSRSASLKARSNSGSAVRSSRRGGRHGQQSQNAAFVTLASVAPRLSLWPKMYANFAGPSHRTAPPAILPSPRLARFRRQSIHAPGPTLRACR